MKLIALISFCAAAIIGLSTPAAGAEMTGQEVFDHYCTYCHGSAEGPGTMQLSRTRGKDQALIVKRDGLGADYIEYVVRHGLKAMPPFVPSDLTDARLKALLSFLVKPQGSSIGEHDRSGELQGRSGSESPKINLTIADFLLLAGSWNWECPRG